MLEAFQCSVVLSSVVELTLGLNMLKNPIQSVHADVYSMPWTFNDN